MQAPKWSIENFKKCGEGHGVQGMDLAAKSKISMVNVLGYIMLFGLFSAKS